MALHREMKIICVVALAVLLCSFAAHYDSKIGQPLLRQLSIVDPSTTILKTKQDDSPAERTPTEDIPVTVFYNVYLSPENDELKEKAKTIVEEQIEQAANSGLAERNNVKLNIITIGASVDDSLLLDICKKNNLDCIHLNHYDEGFEMVTQQHLLDYCKTNEHESHTVAYIHSKGSFHYDKAQDRLRRFGTESVLSDECLTYLGNNTCNVCGQQFVKVWGPLFWGTFWSAKCNYVKKLVSPFDIEAKLQEALDSRPQEMTDGYFPNIHPAYLGKGRFAAEQFVTTHPSLVPCGRYIFQKEKYWSVNPSFDFKIPGDTDFTPDMAMRDYAFLPGILWRYHKLYDEMPPSDSWIWSNYDAGEKWKHAVEKHGYPGAFHEMIKMINAHVPVAFKE